jgi:hypothetical protein
MRLSAAPSDHQGHSSVAALLLALQVQP